MWALRTEGLCRNFGGLQAVRDVSITVEPGEVRALIGPNGAGKSTLLNLLAGTLKPSAGRVYYGSREVTKLPVDRRARLSMSRSYQVVSLFPEMTCREVLQLALQRDQRARGWVSRSEFLQLTSRSIQLLQQEGLDEICDSESMQVSHGLQKRLELTLALANQAQLLLLDEPMAGMSLAERMELRTRLRSLGGERTVVFVEHDMDMVMTLADKVTLLHNGSVVAEGTPQEIKASHIAQNVYLRAGQ